MVHKSLPKTLIKRLKAAYLKTGKRKHLQTEVVKNPISLNKIKLANYYRFMSRLPNIDHREFLTSKETRHLSDWGERVRAFNVSRNYPKVKEIVLKRTHVALAEAEINYIRKNVRKHNLKVKSKKYVLVTPKAYAVGENIVAMAKTNYPSVEEVLGGFMQDPTERGKTFIKNLRKKGATQKKLENAVHELKRNLLKHTNWKGICNAHFLVTNYKGGKFTFVPLIDIESKLV